MVVKPQQPKGKAKPADPLKEINERITALEAEMDSVKGVLTDLKLIFTDPQYCDVIEETEDACEE